MREALVVMIPKQGKDPKMISSYRPISMLNIDTKILCRVLANRLLPYLPRLVHPDQNGFIPGRNTLYNIRRLTHVYHSPVLQNDAYALAFLDIEQAFDSISWDYLWMVLKGINMGDDYMQWIKLLYAGAEVRVWTGGLVSDSFPLGRGTRQGCPLSPLLFALAIEPLANTLRRVMGPWGIQIGEIRHVLSLYADDALLCQTARIFDSHFVESNEGIW